MSKPFKLYTLSSPNGHKVTIFLEELKAIYPGIEYDYEDIDMSKNIQKEPWFIKLNPNGRLPVLIDRSRDDFIVFETAAILIYLQQHYDTDGQFGFAPKSNEESETIQWISFAHGGIGPIQGQLTHYKYAKEKVPYAINRYFDETKRLYGVLEIRLKDREWLVGDKYSIADIYAWPWVRGHRFSGIERLNEWHRLKAWFERVDARPGVQAGLDVPPMASSFYLNI